MYKQILAHCWSESSNNVEKVGHYVQKKQTHTPHQTSIDMQNIDGVANNWLSNDFEDYGACLLTWLVDRFAWLSCNICWGRHCWLNHVCGFPNENRGSKKMLNTVTRKNRIFNESIIPPFIRRMLFDAHLFYIHYISPIPPGPLLKIIAGEQSCIIYHMGMRSRWIGAKMRSILKCSITYHWPEMGHSKGQCLPLLCFQWETPLQCFATTISTLC